MSKLDDYMPWRDQIVLDIVGDNMWHDKRKAGMDKLEFILFKLQNSGIDLGLMGAPEDAHPKYPLKEAIEAIKSLMLEVIGEDQPIFIEPNHHLPSNDVRNGLRAEQRKRLEEL